MKKKNKVPSEPVSITSEEQFEIIRKSLSKLSEKLGYPIEIRNLDLDWKPPTETTSVSMRPLSPIKNKDNK